MNLAIAVAIIVPGTVLIGSGGNTPSGNWQLEDSSGFWQLEDGSGSWQLEG